MRHVYAAAAILGLGVSSVFSAYASDLRLGDLRVRFKGYQVEVRTHGQWIPAVSFPIPDARRLFALRPALRAKYGIGKERLPASGAVYGVESTIGTAALAGSRLWVGFAFYEGEFFDGVGGVGFYDTRGGRLGVLRHPALVDCSTKSLKVSSSTIYAVTESFREAGRMPCRGIVEIDMRTMKAASYGASDRDGGVPDVELESPDFLDRIRTFPRREAPTFSPEVLGSIDRLGLEEFMMLSAEEEFRGMVRGMD